MSIYQNTASVVTHLIMSSSPRPVLDGDTSIKVYGIVVTNQDAANIRTVTFTDTDSKTLLIVEAPVSSTTVVDITWLADNGVNVAIDTTDSDVTVTLFTSQRGA